MMFRNLEAGNKVIPLYINTIIDDGQKKAEHEALKHILHYLSERFGYDMINSWPQEIDMTVPYCEGIALQQPLVWINGSFLYAQNEHVDEIQLGYIMEDHALSYQKEILGLYAALNKFSISYIKKEKQPKIVFPLIKHLKSSIIAQVAENMPVLFKYISFCEKPNEDGSRCKECHSCKKADASKYDELSKYAERLAPKDVCQYDPEDRKVAFFDGNLDHQLDLPFEDEGDDYIDAIA
jgi:hypothetical protein